MKRAVVTSLFLLSMACSPSIYLKQRPEKANVSIKLDGKGENTYVQLMLASKEGDSTWKVEFKNERPEQLTVDKVISTTHIRWKLSPDRSKALDHPIVPVLPNQVPPYELTLTSQDGQATKLVILFSHRGVLVMPPTLPLK